MVIHMMCEDIKQMVRGKDFKKATRVLGNGANKLGHCLNFPDLIILLLEGTVEGKISEEEALRILFYLKARRILDREAKERVRCLEIYSELKPNLTNRILLELI